MKQRSIRFGVLVLVMILLPVHIATLRGQSQSEIAAKFEKRSHTFHKTTLPYRLFVPEQYTPLIEYPLVLALHGAGERGTDNEKQILANRMATSWADTINQNRCPCFVVAPQCPPNNRWVDCYWTSGFTYSTDEVPISNELETVNDLLDSLIREFSVDMDRFYVTGLSMGGYGTWDMIARFPSRFAAAVPMCGCGDTSKVEEFKIVSIWDFHGALDSSVPVQCSRLIFDTMEEHNIDVFRTVGLSDSLIADGLNQGAKHIYTEYPDGTHSIWDQSYDYPLLFPWVFAQTRQSSPVVAEETDRLIVHQFRLEQNYPNPFNPTTTIPYDLPQQSHVLLKVYDVQGREVATLVDEDQHIGSHTTFWNASGFASGVYFYRLQAGKYSEIKKLILVR